MDDNEMMLVLHDLIENMQEARPKWSLDRIGVELQEMLSLAIEEAEESAP